MSFAVEVPNGSGTGRSARADTIADFLLRDVNRAIRDFDLIADGDRIAVGVSGGKDSRTLLDLLVRGIDIAGSYEVIAVHIDGTNAGLPDQTATLRPWFDALDVEYRFAPLLLPDDEPLPMDCFRCAWNRRKSLFFAADELGCSKVAFGHHADDAAVTTLMSLMYKGQVETLEPALDFFQGRFLVIRPLIYVAESDIARYARACGWISPPEPSCPGGQESRRIKIEQFLATLPKREYDQIRTNLWRVARHEDADSNGEADL